MSGSKRICLAAGILSLAFVAQLFWSPPAQAREYPWCARYDWTTYNCGFVSFQQCLATVRGIGGICEPNPRYAGQPARRKPRRAR
ncbi:MAG: DUF3551 domain-containing protein [Pseudorhodoplanes sp.]|nr:hypothetical protein [Pseudorhodoplanes sp.]MCQ3943719.1 hypothetical protein [Alphaproteobacteria bacterium]MBW7950441.1 DUF3551 domain-containing protein [Pseudorhodoplanes sp.]MCL4709871.1 DUF3551 domain-containing protein [Pseudorhodoplanes sp.]MCZ7642096.1 DUF3551 domain-containing protein [Pseudorhodoplanes sp.]